eukprot:560095-Pyramimonas_sp.AAC.1
MLATGASSESDQEGRAEGGGSAEAALDFEECFQLTLGGLRGQAEHGQRPASSAGSENDEDQISEEDFVTAENIGVEEDQPWEMIAPSG